MRRYGPQLSKIVLFLLPALFTFVACGSASATRQAAATSTPTLIPTAETQVAGVITLSPEYLFWLTNTQLKAISAPKLFINSVDDGYADDTQQIFQNALAPKELHLYPGNAHGVAIFRTENGQDL